MYDEKKASREALEKLELAQLLTQLEKLEIPEAADTRTPMERMVEELKSSHAVARLMKKRTAHVQPNKKLHWKTKRRKKREYYQSYTKYRRLEQRGELLAEGSAGWWKYLTTVWHRKKVEVEMTYDQWNEHIWPTLQGRVPVIRRYQPNKPISLGNVYVTESGSDKTVLFDGKEHVLRAAGYIL